MQRSRPDTALGHMARKMVRREKVEHLVDIASAAKTAARMETRTPWLGRAAVDTFPNNRCSKPCASRSSAHLRLQSKDRRRRHRTQNSTSPSALEVQVSADGMWAL